MAQRTEHRPPKPGAQVRFSPGAPLKSSLPANAGRFFCLIGVYLVLMSAQKISRFCRKSGRMLAKAAGEMKTAYVRVRIDPALKKYAL